MIHIFGLLLAASCIYEDPHNHATGTPLAGTYSSATNATAVVIDSRPQTQSDATMGSWDARLASWFTLGGWGLLNPAGTCLFVR